MWTGTNIREEGEHLWEGVGPEQGRGKAHLDLLVLEDTVDAAVEG